MSKPYMSSFFLISKLPDLGLNLIYYLIFFKICGKQEDNAISEYESSTHNWTHKIKIYIDNKKLKKVLCKYGMFS